MNPVGDLIVVFHGFVIAAVFLFIASFTWGLARGICLWLGVMALMWQCTLSVVIEDIGQATTGAASDGSLMKVTIIGTVVGLMWCVGIGAFWRRKPIRDGSDPNPFGR